MPDFTPVSEDPDRYFVSSPGGGAPVPVLKDQAQSLGYMPTPGGTLNGDAQNMSSMPNNPPAPQIIQRDTPELRTAAVPFAAVAGIGSPQQQRKTEMTKETVQNGFKVPQALVNEQTGIDMDQQRAIADAAKTGQQRATELAAYNQKVSDDSQAHMAQMAARQAAQQKSEDAQIQASQNAVTEFSNSPKIDPKALWKGHTGAQVMATIGVALGAFGSALTHTPNTALDIINKAIDDNISAQKSELDRKAHNVVLQGNLLSQLRARGLDEDARDNAARQIYSDMAAKQVAAVSSKYDIPAVAQNRDQLLLGLRQQSLAKKDQQAKDAQNKAIRETTSTQMDSAPNFSNLNDQQKFFKDNSAITTYQKNREALDRWNGYVSSGAQGVALADFVKDDIKAGRLSPETIDMLANKGIWDKTKAEFSTRYHGFDAELIENIQKGMETNLAASKKRADPVLDKMRAAGVDPAMFIGGNNTAEDAADLGGRPAQ